MTTAGRRTPPVSNERPLDLEDCRCPVCLEIFLEPVTLPCTHTFCKDCFLESVDKAALSCPLCRRRVSTWARANSRNKTLVNEQLWQRIQVSFPQQCERRRGGQAPEDDFGGLVSFPTVSQPGELQREYQDQISKLTEEKRALDEEERKASELFIQSLLEQEEEELREEERRREEDERLAKQLSSQLNSSHSIGISPISKKKEVTSGQIERFFSPRQTKPSSVCSPDATNFSNKENIVLSNLDFYDTSSSRTETLQRSQPCSQSLTPKRRTSEREAPDDDEEVVFKRSCYSSFLEGPVLPSTAEHEWEAETLRRHQQEEEDRRMALLLQKEFDQEEKRRISDRSKGTPDAYPLRQNHAARRESCSKTPSQVKRKNSYSSSSGSSSDSSSSSSGRGNKQTTLTEMFSSR